LAQNVASVAAVATVVAAAVVVDAEAVGFVATVGGPWYSSMINNKDIILFLSINYKRIINTFLITHSLITQYGKYYWKVSQKRPV
jgi:hypothetical protein